MSERLFDRVAEEVRITPVIHLSLGRLGRRRRGAEPFPGAGGGPRERPFPASAD